MQRKIIIAYFVAGSLLLVALLVSAFTTRHRVVSVRVLDKRLTIQNLHLFTGTNFNFWYVPTSQQPKYQCQRVLDALGIPLPWRRYYPLKVLGPGPVILISGLLLDGDATWLYLVREGEVDDYRPFPTANGFTKQQGLPFVWVRPLRLINDFGVNSATNGVFHMKQIGDSNDLAVIRIP